MKNLVINSRRLSLRVKRGRILIWAVAVPGVCAGVSAQSVLQSALAIPEHCNELPSQLDEISGLTSVNDSVLVAVQDEKGWLYFLSSESLEVVDRLKFRGDGDYEGVALAGQSVFVLRSDGDLFEIVGWQDGTPDVQRYESILGGSCDAEGLAFSSEANRMLVVCKRRARKRHRLIYAFELDDRTWVDDPVYRISLDSLRLSARRNGSRVRRGAFRPSGLAIRPNTDQVWMTMTKFRGVATIDSEGEVLDVFRFPRRLMRQPEAIAFGDTNEVFIATEAAGDVPRICRFLLRETHP